MLDWPNVLNRSDVPSRYLKPYTQWVWRQLPQVRDPLHDVRELDAQGRPLGRSHNFRASREYRSVGEYGTSGWIKPKPIEAFAYYTPEGERAGECYITYREPGETRKKGDVTRPSHLSIFIPRGTAQSQTDREVYLKELHERLFMVTCQIGAALGYFGREPLPPGGGLAMYRQRVGKVWSAHGHQLLARWRTYKCSKAGVI